MLMEACVLSLLSCLLLTRRAHCAKNINSCFQKRSSNSTASKAPPIGMLKYVVVATLPQIRQQWKKRSLQHTGHSGRDYDMPICRWDLCKTSQEGKYVMEVSKDLYVDAEHDPYDVGYLYYLDDSVRGQLRSPPNYGRYINTIYPEDVSLGGYTVRL